MGLVEEFERLAETDAVIAAHQGLVTEDGPGRDLDDRLEGIFHDQFRERDQLISSVTPENGWLDSCGRGHPKLHTAQWPKTSPQPRSNSTTNPCPHTQERRAGQEGVSQV